MLQLVNSPNVQIIYDPVNFFPLDRCHEQEKLMDQAFEMFGDRIVAIHSKDYLLKDGIKTGDLPSGTGEMNHRYLTQLLNEKKPYIQVLLEVTSADNVEQVINFIRASEEQ
jgi:L-ribulose-5-phosphate 3-epimerase